MSEKAGQPELALGELGCFTGFLQAVLTTLLGAGIAAEVAFGFERLAVVGGQIA
jgi:hypothetical protein